MKTEPWEYLPTGAIVRWVGELYFVMGVHRGDDPHKHGVQLAPLDAGNVTIHVSRKWPYDELLCPECERTTMSQGQQRVGSICPHCMEGELRMAKAAVRLEGIEMVASCVKELIMRRVEALIFDAKGAQ